MLFRSHPEVIAAVQQQLAALPFAPRRFTCEPSVRLAERLAARFEAYTGHPGKVLFAPGGSEAVEIALKLARAATGRHKTLSFWDAFHGAGFGAASVGGEALFRSGPIGPLLPGANHVAPFHCYRCPYGHDCDETGSPRLDHCRLACAGMVEFALAREPDTAAVIASPTSSQTPGCAGWPLTTTGHPAAKALAVSPPATPKARGKLLAPKTPTGPKGIIRRRKSGLGRGALSASALCNTGSRKSPEATVSANCNSCEQVLPISASNRPAGNPVSRTPRS